MSECLNISYCANSIAAALLIEDTLRKTVEKVG